MKTKNIIYMLLLLTFFNSCKEEQKKTIITPNIEFKKEGALHIFNKENNTLKAYFNIEIAESDYETQTGLMYRKGMGEKEAMLFIFPEEKARSFYMKNTEFPLDIIYINKDLKIASIQENTTPFNQTGLPSKVPVKYALEINATLTQRLNITTGDLISFNRD